MIKRLVNVYKIPILISITVFVVLLALTVERNPMLIAFMFLGAILGTFVMELDYFINAYFLEPQSEFSKSVKGYITHHDYTGLINFIHFHKNDVTDKTLNSVLFQVVLAGGMFVVSASNASLFFKALVISTFTASIYRMIELYFQGQSDSWFWALKQKPTKEQFQYYTVALIVALIICFSIY